VEGEYFLQPFVEVEGEKNDIKQQAIGEPFSIPNIDGSHPSKETDEEGDPPHKLCRESNLFSSI
jgi:hypothetical protein